MKALGEILMVVGLSIVAVSAVFYVATAPRAQEKEPSQVLCAVFDLSTPSGRGEWRGWHPLSDQHRGMVKELALKGQVEIIEADSIECIERHEQNKRFGDVIETRRMEWWRPVQGRAKGRSGHTNSVPSIPSQSAKNGGARHESKT